MMQSDPPAVEIDVIAFSPSPLFSASPHRLPKGRRMQLCAGAGDLLQKLMKGRILDVTLENGPAWPEKCGHLLLLNEQMFLLCNRGVCVLLHLL